MNKPATNCSECLRVVYVTDVDADGRCVFCEGKSKVTKPVHSVHVFDEVNATILEPVKPKK